MGKVINFDEYLKERAKSRDYKIVLFGNTYNLPPSLPYQVVLFFKSLAGRAANETVDDEMIISMFELIFGADNVAEMKSKLDFDVDLMLEILKTVLDLYGVTKPASEATESGPKEATTD